METVDIIASLQAAASASDKPACMTWAAALAESSAMAPLILLWLGDEGEDQQLLDLGVFYAAVGPPHWSHPLVLHHALSCGHPPSDEVAQINAMTLMGKLARQFDDPFPYLQAWTAWSLVDWANNECTAEDAIDTLWAVSGSKFADLFLTAPAVRALKRIIPPSDSIFAALPKLNVERNIASLSEESTQEANALPESVAAFVQRLRKAAVRDLDAYHERGVGKQTMTVKLSWREQADAVLRYARQTFAMLEALTRKQDIHDYQFATGSLIVSMSASGSHSTLPALSGPSEADSNVMQKLRPLLLGVENGDIHLSVTSVPAGGTRPLTWAPRAKQARAMVAESDSGEARTWECRVTLRGTDPFQKGTGYARLQVVGETSMIRAKLAHEGVIDTQSMNTDYVASLERRQGDPEWSLQSLLTPLDAASKARIDTFKGTQIPRVSSLDRLLEFLTLVNTEGSVEQVAPAGFGVETASTIKYWAHFGKSMLALDSNGRVTKDGGLAIAGGKQVLKSLFRQSPTARGLLAHVSKASLADVTHDDVQTFVQEAVPDLTGSSQVQRVDALWRLVKASLT